MEEKYNELHIWARSAGDEFYDEEATDRLISDDLDWCDGNIGGFGVGLGQTSLRKRRSFRNKNVRYVQEKKKQPPKVISMEG